MRGRYDVLEQVLKLDIETQHQQIVHLVGAYESPWLMKKSLEFALFRTYAVPSIGALLDQTAQFHQHGQKRYDDTSLLIAEFVEHGYDSERGRTAIRRMNQLHRRWQISNEDFLYVLAAFIFVPIIWHERYGWRKPTPHEQRASYVFWCEVGRRMNLHDIPDTLEGFKRYFHDYERQHFRYTPASQRVAESSIRVFLAWYPRWVHPMVREVIYALMDDPLREALGYPKPHSLLQGLVQGGLWLRGRILRYLPPRRTPYSLTQAPNRTYPKGYQIESLGRD